MGVIVSRLNGHLKPYALGPKARVAALANAQASPKELIFYYCNQIPSTNEVEQSTTDGQFTGVNGDDGDDGDGGDNGGED
eukprot:15059664-Ditylum_brightwellii.AAC.1